MAKLDKDVRNAIYLVTTLIIILVIIFFFVMPAINDKYDEECFNQFGTSYCNSMNQTYYIYGGPTPSYELGIFRCQEKTYNPRSQNGPNINIYEYLPIEKDKCTTKSWFARVILKEN